jgi:hypothetical protein
MDQPGTRRLREHLRRHNRRVLLLSIATFVAAAALWAFLYFMTLWMFLLAHTVVSPLDDQPAIAPLIRGFAATAVVLCLFAWLARRLHPNEAARDHTSFVGHLIDLILAVPRVTLAIFGLTSATARLNDRELEHAWSLLRRMNNAPKPLPIQSLPVEIPDPSTRDKILLALQLGGLVEIRPTYQGPVLAFRNDKARDFAEEHVRLRF